MPTQRDIEVTLADYKQLVTIETVGKYVVVRPKKYLANKWQPIMDALNSEYGKLAEWIRNGKQSHWRLLINGGAVAGSAADAARTIDNIIAQLTQLKNDLAGNAK